MTLPTARRSFRFARCVKRWLVVVSVVVGALSVSPSSARAEPIRLWHAYRGLEEKALEQVLSTWEGDPVEPLAVPLATDPVSVEAQFLYDAGNRWFDNYIWNIILTPNYNSAHDNHYHVDMTPSSHFIGRQTSIQKKPWCLSSTR